MVEAVNTSSKQGVVVAVNTVSHQGVVLTVNTVPHQGVLVTVNTVYGEFLGRIWMELDGHNFS